MRILATILLLVLSSKAWSTELQNIKANVFLQDSATGGCWTNLKETREYAEEKLRMKNIQIADFDVPEFVENEFWLFIEVTAVRTVAGNCSGFMNVRLISFFKINEQWYTIVRNSKMQSALIPSNNFNNYILDVVKDLFSEMN